MKTYCKSSFRAIMIGVVLITLSNPSLAESSNRKIGYTDLDLEQQADVAVLYDRIKTAARIVCTDSKATWGFHRKAFNRCYLKTVDKAVTGMNNSILTSLHKGQEVKVARR